MARAITEERAQELYAKLRPFVRRTGCGWRRLNTDGIEDAGTMKPVSDLDGAHVFATGWLLVDLDSKPGEDKSQPLTFAQFLEVYDLVVR